MKYFAKIVLGAFFITLFHFQISSAAIVRVAGCNSTSIYSAVTGQKCSIGKVLGDSTDATPRIMYWYGKVNQHVDVSGVWQSDPDGTSGANLDKLAYCKKWYPNTVSVVPYKSETIDTWRRAMYYEQSGYTATETSDECVQQDKVTPVDIAPTVNTMGSVTVLTPNGGEAFTVNPDYTNFTSWFNASAKVTSQKSGTLSLSIVQYANANNTGNTLPMGSSNLTAPNASVFTMGRFGDFPYPSGHYYLMAQWLSNDGTERITDFSNSSFTINVPSDQTNITCSKASNPSIKVVSPNGGETYQDGQQITIKWSSCNLYGTSIVPLYLNAYDANNTLIGTIGLGSSTNDGMETVTLPTISYLQNGATIPGATFGTHFKVSLVGTDNINALTTTDYSDNLFSIQSNNLSGCGINSFTSDPSIVNVGGMSRLSYEMNQNCRSFAIPQIGYTSLGVAGNQQVGPLSHTTTYTLKASSNEGCNGTVAYSTTNGQSCNYATATTVVTVNNSSPQLPNGCTSTNGYSTTSGQPCNLPEGCMSATGYSTVTGQPCIPIGKTPITTPSSAGLFIRTLKLGTTGADVTALQNRLKSEGVYDTTATGYFGTATQAAVKKFQIKYGLSAVGSVGPQTLQLLNK